ncbi:MAG: hypothetical protein WDZ69_00505 [Candidatus Pacearchaeota archaeon]
MVLNIILLTIGILALLEAAFILFFPKRTVKILRFFLKNAENTKKAGLIELAIAIALILVGILI